MGKKEKRGRINSSISLLLSIVLVFCILGTVVFSVARKISKEMSSSAINKSRADQRDSGGDSDKRSGVPEADCPGDCNNRKTGRIYSFL